MRTSTGLKYYSDNWLRLATRRKTQTDLDYASKLINKNI